MLPIENVLRQALAGVAERAVAEVVGEDAVEFTDKGAEISIAGNPVEIKPRLVESVFFLVLQ